MNMNKIKVKYTLHNVSTKSVVKGWCFIPGTSYAAIVDGLAKLIEARIPKILKQKNMSSEDPKRWAVLGFGEYRHWKARKDRSEA
jgi:hypothetical protein